MNELRQVLVATSDGLNDRLDAEMEAGAADTLSANAAARTMTLTVSILGVLLGLREIPQLLQRIMGMCMDMADRISSGAFRSRLEEKEFEGDFSELAKSVNTICASYTGILDSPPLRLMSADRDRKIVFLKGASQGSFAKADQSSAGWAYSIISPDFLW